MSDKARAAFSNYPELKAHDVPYEAPPTAANPVIKGRPLSFLASVYD